MSISFKRKPRMVSLASLGNLRPGTHRVVVFAYDMTLEKDPSRDDDRAAFPDSPMADSIASLPAAAKRGLADKGGGLIGDLVLLGHCEDDRAMIGVDRLGGDIESVNRVVDRLKTIKKLFASDGTVTFLHCKFARSKQTLKKIAVRTGLGVRGSSFDTVPGSLTFDHVLWMFKPNGREVLWLSP